MFVLTFLPVCENKIFPVYVQAVEKGNKCDLLRLAETQGHVFIRLKK